MKWKKKEKNKVERDGGGRRRRAEKQGTCPTRAYIIFEDQADNEERPLIVLTSEGAVPFDQHTEIVAFVPNSGHNVKKGLKNSLFPARPVDMRGHVVREGAGSPGYATVVRPCGARISQVS